MAKYVDINQGLAFLDFMKARKFTRNGIVNDYKNFDSEIEKYKNILSSFYKTYGHIDTYGSFRNYHQNISVKGFYEYDLCWNIDYIGIKNQQIRPINISFEDVCLGDKEVNEQYSMNVAINNTEPILAAFIPILNENNDVIIFDNSDYTIEESAEKIMELFGGR